MRWTSRASFNSCSLAALSVTDAWPVEVSSSGGLLDRPMELSHHGPVGLQYIP